MNIRSINFWSKTGAVFLLRSGRSAIMLCLMVVAAVSALIFLSSLAMGVNDAMIFRPFAHMLIIDADHGRDIILLMT